MHMLCVCQTVDVLIVDWVCLHQTNNGHFVFEALKMLFFVKSQTCTQEK